MATRQPVLVLDVATHGDGLRVSLLQKTPGTWRTVVPLYQHPIDPDRIRTLNRDIYAILNRANRRGDIDRGSSDMLRRAGQRLFDELLPDAVKERLRTAAVAGVDELVLCLDEPIVYLPWELLHTGHGFLGLDFVMGRIVRSERAPIGPPRVLDAERPSEMLIICDPRDDLMASYYEGVSIRDDMDLHRDRVEVALKSSEVDVAWVQEAIRDYDIVHYAGHADYVTRAPNDSGWKLAGGKLTAREILRVAGGAPFPLLVFANACRSGTMAPVLLTERHGEGVFGLANAFLLAGVQHFIGALWDIPDESACHFALAFYRELMTGVPVGAAVRAARRALVKRYGQDSVLWGSYVFYGDPTFAIFARFPVETVSVPRLPTPIPRGGGELGAPRRIAPRTVQEEVPVRRVARLRGALALPDLELPRPRLPRAALPVVAVAAALAVVVGVALAMLAPREEEARIVTYETVPPTRLAMQDLASLRPSLAVASAGPALAEPVRAEARVFVQTVDAAGGVDVVEIPAGAELMGDDGFQVQLRVNRPAYTYVFLVGTRGDVAQLLPSPGAAVPYFRDSDAWVRLPSSESWYRAGERRGLYAVVLAASVRPVENLKSVISDVASIRDKVVRESPLVHVLVHRVPLGTSSRGVWQPITEDEAVSVTQVDVRRFERELAARLRQSFDAVELRTLRVR